MISTKQRPDDGTLHRLRTLMRRYYSPEEINAYIPTLDAEQARADLAQLRRLQPRQRPDLRFARDRISGQPSIVDPTTGERVDHIGILHHSATVYRGKGRLVVVRDGRVISSDGAGDGRAQDILAEMTRVRYEGGRQIVEDPTESA